MPTYEISTDPARLDVGAIHAFLTRSYWSPGIPRATVERAIANSLCFGVFCEGRQVGFARMVTDKTTFAYLCDVYVLEEHRSRGLAKQLMEHIMRHPDLQGLRRMMLATHDAHGLYAQYGFTALGAPERIMERHRPGVYSQVKGESG
jgi:GNAT superfamily N-acetyltransferase